MGEDATNFARTWQVLDLWRAVLRTFYPSGELMDFLTHDAWIEDSHFYSRDADEYVFEYEHAYKCGVLPPWVYLSRAGTEEENGESDEDSKHPPAESSNLDPNGLRLLSHPANSFLL